MNLGFYRELTEAVAGPSRGWSRYKGPTGVFPRSFPDHGSYRGMGVAGSQGVLVEGLGLPTVSVLVSQRWT